MPFFFSNKVIIIKVLWFFLTPHLSGVKTYINCRLFYVTMSTTFIILFVYLAVWVFVAVQAFSQLQSVGLLFSCDVQASHCGGGFSCCGPQALGHSGICRCCMWDQQLRFLGSRAQDQQLWNMGLLASRHMGSS